MLYDGCCVVVVRMNDLAASVNVVPLDQLVLVFIKILCVRELLLKRLGCEASQEVGPPLRLHLFVWSIVVMFKLGLADKLLASTWSEDGGVSGLPSYINCLSLEFVVSVWPPQEVLPWINE